MKVTKLVHSVSDNKNSDNMNIYCDTFSRDPFSVSHHRASDIFKLIHFDLWGLYWVLSSCGASYFLTVVDFFPVLFSYFYLLTKFR